MRKLMDLTDAFAITTQYRALLEFSNGLHGWFIPPTLRRQAADALQELVLLRTLRDNPPTVCAGPTTAPSVN